MNSFSSKLKSSLSKKILVRVLLISSVVTFFTSFTQLSYEFYQDKKNLQNSLNVVENSYVTSISNFVWELQESQLKEALSGIANIPGIQYAKVFTNGKLLSAAGNANSTSSIKRVLPLLHDDKGTKTEIGQIEVAADLDQVIERMKMKIVIIFFSQLVKTLTVSLLIYFMIQYTLTNPLLRTTAYLRDLDFKKPQPDFVVRNNTLFREKYDELDIMAAAINEMRTNLYRSYSDLASFNANLEKLVSEKTDQLIEQRQKMEYKSKMQALGEMAAGIAHEVNNPLAIIQLSGKQLERIQPEPEAIAVLIRKKVLNIVNASERVAKIIAAMRFFSRIEDEKKLELFHIGAVWDQTIELCQSKFIAKGIELKRDPFPENALVCGRAVQMSQVILNLLSNSLDAVESLPVRWVKVSAQCDTDSTSIIITDSGNGIPEVIRDKIMQPFFTTKEVGKGAGLGLSVAKGLVEEFGGTISVDSSKPNTTFEIRMKNHLPKIADSAAS